MADPGALNYIKSGAMTLGGTAIAVVIVIAILTGFQNTNQVDNTTVQAFITALGVFGSFAGVVAIGLMGFGLFKMFGGGKKNSL